MPTLTQEIARVEGQDTQVKCSIDGTLLLESYGFGESYTDEQIDAHIRSDLSAKGHVFD